MNHYLAAAALALVALIVGLIILELLGVVKEPRERGPHE